MARVILSRPHICHGQFCVDYRFDEPVAGVVDGRVGMVPTPGMTNTEILNAMIPIVVDHANLQTSHAQPFTAADVITWECLA